MSKFIDYAEIGVKGGDGGSGCLSFRREKYVPKGGPDGGDGGNGGDVIIQVDQHLGTLLDFKYKRYYRAENGKSGKGKNQQGKKGNDVVIKVPPGTMVKDLEKGKLLSDLVSEDQLVVVAKGGKRGRGNAYFKTPTEKSPRKFENGQKGEQKRLSLELKVLADVGIVGYPNSGKSTLLAKLSQARPKIDDYPFTTLHPNLGVVKMKNYHSFILADIPGLIQDAHKGKGLGLEFLRHIQRTKVLIFLLDATSPDFKEQFHTLKKEMRLFDPGLLKKKAILVLNKIDLLTSRRFKINLNSQLPRCRISALTGEGLEKLLKLLDKELKREK
ncbi:MAG: GTPase ObgE [Candidatus Zixiibacteriota bacterium]